jgi:hypothetical protein
LALLSFIRTPDGDSEFMLRRRGSYEGSRETVSVAIRQAGITPHLDVAPSHQPFHQPSTTVATLPLAEDGQNSARTSLLTVETHVGTLPVASRRARRLTRRSTLSPTNVFMASIRGVNANLATRAFHLMSLEIYRCWTIAGNVVASNVRPARPGSWPLRFQCWDAKPNLADCL